MKIAVGVYRFHFFVFAKRETGFRFVGRRQCFALIAAGSLNGDPLDVVLGDHGVSNFADGDKYLLILDLKNRNVFFDRSE